MRLDGLPTRVRRMLIVLMLLLAGLSATIPAKPAATADRASERSTTDPELYRHIIARVAKGESYYDAAATEQRAAHYPLKPFLTIRLPILARLSGWLGIAGAVLLLRILALATVLAWFWRLRATNQGWPLVAASGLIAIQCGVMTDPVMALFHESWAALLMALSLAFWSPGRWRTSVGLGLVACLFRETAAPFLMLMLAAAALENRWREVAAWVVAIFGFGIVLWLHASAVAGVVLNNDLASQGWMGGAGWPLLASALAKSTALDIAPAWLARVLIPLALFGWIAWRDALGLRVAGLMTGYAVMLLLFARPDTWYWALMPAPLLVAGLAFVPAIFKAWRTQDIAAKPGA